jgi:hypothetical protein
MNRIRSRGVCRAFVAAGGVLVAGFLRRVARRPLVIIPLAVAGIALSGSGGTPVVPRAELEHKVAQSLGAAVHRAPPNISCPGDLPGKVGAAVHCVLSVAGGSDRFGVLVRVTSVSGSHVRFHVQVGTAPLPAASG